MTTTTSTTRLQVHAVDPERLDAVRTAGADGHGNPFVPFAASGEGEPLRCCLRYARADVATVHVRTVLPQCFLYAVTTARVPS